MTRIISGTHGGRRLSTPTGEGTRPTSDRVREAVFSRLEHLGVLEEAHVLDLCCGSGALGLEAVSRGAAGAQLVDRDRAAANVARRNVRDLGLAGVSVHQEAMSRFLAGPVRVADVVLLDPPYGLGEPELADVLARLVAGGWLAPGAVLVVERSSRSPEPGWPHGIEPVATKRYGETVVHYAAHLAGDAGPGGGLGSGA